ncbi:glycoside hydrolase family 31 protein [Chitinophagaceae bacterium LB-8]|uniref:Glycoside hydrolase family 31 protein n=1 Tax=Paraflavisolibacter caeni TaxID=2982496 RepID=A0A9X2XWZ1_9BACT|nr:TIM-barrel domain-containing protein [Paraflavisolibacter caeni]MCU7550212.1 glycoside hydrolase family 31 protein [Paraflavisolibacter caeni]
MKSKILLLIALIPAIVRGQVYQKHSLQQDRLSIQLSEGLLHIVPLSENAIRVQWQKEEMKETHEFVLINKHPVPAFQYSETPSKLKLSTKQVTVLFDKNTGNIDFIDQTGKVFLSEKAGSRKLIRDSIQGEPCFIAEQSFDSPADEYLYGLGQFQDGQYNLRNVSRKLIQVNSQIAIPFLYSSRGYGILWHQYGLTDFNPADHVIALSKKDTATGGKQEAEVTTTTGTQRVSQQQSLYTGKFSVDKDGAYTMMLDLGGMDSRHLVTIDGTPHIDQSNLWLPPAVGKMIHLKAGEHTVQVVCRTSNTPKLSWKKAGNETTFRSPHAKSLDYVIFYGKNADEVIADYRNLSGNVPMLPLWAYGFWQCRERYTSGKHLVETVKEFRKRKLPMDVIVQDWQYWGKYGWGVPKFDETNYPNPDKFIQQLHDLNAHFSVSVWENLDKNSDVAKDYISKNLYIPNSPWIDIYNPETRQTHWNAINKNLFQNGVDSWWMDATEPENDALAGKQTYFGPGNFYRLTYPLFVSKAIYEGQRKTNPQKRVAILTRSAFAGQQRYGTINWSGDIGWDWDTYKRQIVAGLNYSLTGMPYWTTDIGGFFRPGRSQYTDEKYHDLLTRWFQWGTFNTIFRMHGYQTETEPWKYGDTVEANMRRMLELRYRLLPYIYSEAWQVSSKGSTMMRPLVMDFKKDTAAMGQPYQYMFGKSFLVAPITEPGVSTWNVYLPKTTAWYDFWTGKRFVGGQTLPVAAPKDRIPVFVKAGSIVPMGKFLQYSSEKTIDTLEIRIYAGADGHFNLYSDEGDNYNYEKGNYVLVPFQWNEQKQTLTIGKRQGIYPGALQQYIFNIVLVKESQGHGIKMSPATKKVIYKGEKTKVVVK